MDKPKATPKDFFLWAGAMITLYAGVIAFLALVFDYINYAFPDPLRYYGDPYVGGTAYSMASLIVLTPVFMLLMRTIRRSIDADHSRAEIWVRRWALYLTVFAAGATIVVDLIVLLTTFLSGEALTTPFLLKVLVVLLVAGAGFMHFLADIWGYWNKETKKARLVNWSVGLLVLITIVAGFYIIGTPGQARLMRMDQQKVGDLQTIQWQLITFWQQKQALPASLSELNDPISGFVVPTDLETGELYGYSRTSATSFELCADFNAASNDTSMNTSMAPYRYGGEDQNWVHEAGTDCFSRTIDPERYPPFTKPMM